MTTQRKRTSQYYVAIAALAAGGMMNTAMAANNATASATAVVLIPISVAKTTDLSFGKLVAGNGTVTLDTAGARTKSGGTVLPTSTSTAALFTVTGDTTNTFSISYTGSSTVLTNGTPADDMAVTFISEAVGTASPTPVNSGQAATGTLVAGNAYIYVGASLVVGAAQPAGTYTGTVAVTVDYN